MAGPNYIPRALVTSTTTGTGAYTLGSAVLGYQSFAGIGDGNTCFYSAFGVDAFGVPNGDWEEGIGTYTASGTTLARTTILASSNANAAVSWAAGTKRISVVIPHVNGITNELLRQSAALSIPGRSANSQGNLADIAGATVGHVLQVLSGPVLGFGLQGMTLIAENLLGSDQASISFGSIPSTYRHLLIVLYGRLTESVGDQYVYLRFNSDSGSNYDFQHGVFVGSTTSIAANYAQTRIRVGDWTGATSSSANMAGGGLILIPMYAGSTFEKTLHAFGGMVSSTSGANATVAGWTGHWRNAAAVTQIDFTPNANNFKTGSIFSLYGLK